MDIVKASMNAMFYDSDIDPIIIKLSTRAGTSAMFSKASHSRMSNCVGDVFDVILVHMKGQYVSILFVFAAR